MSSKSYYYKYLAIFPWLLGMIITSCAPGGHTDPIRRKADSLLSRMTLEEKIGQMSQMSSPGEQMVGSFYEIIRKGEIGSVLNETRPGVIREMQRIAVEESRMGIPLLFGRDVIHGFRTIFPVNIGLAATWNPQLIEEGARMAAIEASSVGINWTFAPMVDIARDPRWGRMAESFGEDPLLVTEMGLAMLRGFQGNDKGSPPTLAACAKHFAGYGAAEGGRDYNTTGIPDVELWNTYFPPFRALADAGIYTFMSGFNDLNGIPSTGNAFLFRDVLKSRWKFQGMVVSDWESIIEMRQHGFAANTREAALKALDAGIDMEMASTSYKNHMKSLIETKALTVDAIDESVRRILMVKIWLGLFENPYASSILDLNNLPDTHSDLARKTALQSFVLLKNEKKVLPLNPKSTRVAVIGPMANDRYEQLGTWVFDADTNLSITPLMAIREYLGLEKVLFAKGLRTTRSQSTHGFQEALRAARQSDAVIFFAGEESILTGEAHSRAFLDLPGAQVSLIRKIANTGKPLIVVIMTARPLAIGETAQYADALLYAWHPGSMAGPALADVLFGKESPSGKLPVTFPKAPGQIPIYYASKNTGRPATDSSFIPMDEIPVRSFQTSLGNTSHYLDIGFKPLYPFGFGLSYTTFTYSDLQLSSTSLKMTDSLKVSVTLSNTGGFEAEEVVQLYVRDLVASITRPVRELKAFQRVRLTPGESKRIEFILYSSRLGFFDPNGNYNTEEGDYQLWVGGSSDATLSQTFTLIQSL